jgi:hypothetical protein
MKFYGHANLQQNELQNAVLSTLTEFPNVPKIGQIAFVRSTVFICVAISPLPVWVPLTREITAYTHSQPTANSTWNITHNLNTTSVNVQIYDNLNRVILPDDIETISPTQVKVSFSASQAGRAVLVSGHFDGLQKPVYAYTHYQDNASTSWVIQHNLGYNPVVRVFIGNQEVQPLSIVHDSSNQVTLSFSTAQVGYVRLI